MDFELSTKDLKNKVAHFIQIDPNTWVDLSKVIGIEINPVQRQANVHFEVCFAISTTSKQEAEEFNTNFIGAVPFIKFETLNQAIEYLRDLGIEINQDNNELFKKYNCTSRLNNIKQSKADDNDDLTAGKFGAE